MTTNKTQLLLIIFLACIVTYLIPNIILWTNMLANSIYSYTALISFTYIFTYSLCLIYIIIYFIFFISTLASQTNHPKIAIITLFWGIIITLLLQSTIVNFIPVFSINSLSQNLPMGISSLCLMISLIVLYIRWIYKIKIDVNTPNISIKNNLLNIPIIITLIFSAIFLIVTIFSSSQTIIDLDGLLNSGQIEQEYYNTQKLISILNIIKYALILIFEIIYFILYLIRYSKHLYDFKFLTLCFIFSCFITLFIFNAIYGLVFPFISQGLSLPTLYISTGIISLFCIISLIILFSYLTSKNNNKTKP